MSSLLAAVLFALTTSLAPRTPAPVGEDALWSPPEGFLESFHGACAGKSGDAFGACFAAAMKKAGASPAALAFAERTGNRGYLRLFHNEGKVDVACATYPFRANANDVCFLVNGDPAMIDVDDPKNVDQPALDANRGYAALLKRYPKLAIFPGARGDSPGIQAGVRRDGGQEFAVEYFLQDGCHACARIAAMRLGFDFDENGKFLGSRLITIRVLAH